MMAGRVEAQMKWDWDLNPSVFSLHFASQVNLSMSLCLKRALRKGGCADIVNDKNLSRAACNIGFV